MQSVRLLALLAGALALCLWAPLARAQSRFDHWTADTGLPQNSVRDILQTRDGYIWFTTFDGLVRFDGVRFTVFNKSNSPGIASNRFYALFEDGYGDLWAALEAGEIVRRHEGRFTTYTKADGLPGDMVPTFGHDGRGNVVLWFNHWEGEGQVFTRIVSKAYRWADGRFRPAEDLTATFTGVRLLGHVRGIAFQGVIDGEFWAATDRYVVRLRKDGGAQIIGEGNGLPGTEPGLIRGEQNRLQAVTRDAAGRLWVTDLRSLQSRQLSSYAPEGFLGVNGYTDSEGNYWFSTYNSGLFRARKQEVTPYGRAQGLSSTEIYPLLVRRDGSLWVGAVPGKVFKLENGAFTQVPGVSDRGAEALVGPPGALFEDRSGQLWGAGFWRLTDGRFVLQPWASELVARGVAAYAMGEDGEGAYWYGTNYGVIRNKNGVISEFTTKDGLAGNDTRVVVDDGAGGLWFGSAGGLTHYRGGRFTAWTDRDGLPGSTVRALKRDADGTLWIGTYDSGLCRFKDGRFTNYTTKDGLFDSGVFQILEDDYGRFWMSCNRGIYRVRKQELIDFAEGRTRKVVCLAYNESNGMPSSECNGGRWPAGAKTPDGKLWFPTMNGVAMIDPANVAANAQPPPVVVEAMRVDNEPVPADAWLSALRDPGSTIEIRPGQDNFEIEYTALSFVNSGNMRFKYMLEGADHDWVDAGTRRTAYFSHLAPGEYTFRVIAANADGVWNQTGASVRVTVVPPFWRTWWFFALSAIFVAAAGAGAWMLRVAQMERTQRAHEAFARRLIVSQEGERKRIAGELHDSLGQSLVIIRNWAMLGASQLDSQAPAREELDEINDIASRAINEVREIAYNLGPYHLERLGFENSIREMVRRVAEASGIAITTKLESLDGALSRDTELSLYRIAQEGLNNMVKHSNAAEAHVSLTRESAGVRLTVSDDGRGFDPQAAAHDSSGKPGFGLNGMAERVRLLGGTLVVRTAPGNGTSVEVLVPVTAGNGDGKERP